MLVEIDPVLGADGFTLDLNLHFRLFLKNGSQFEQTTALSMGTSQRPLLIELGGTESEPFHFLILRAHVARLDETVRKVEPEASRALRQKLTR